MRAVVLAAVTILLAGCRTLGYYGHVVHGHFELMGAREPIARMVDDATLAPDLRARLDEVLVAREFASERLRLPRNRSYTYYVALDRPYPSWILFAAPEFSVEPLTHCFPFAGCVAYRGYFDRDKARREAQRLHARGYQTHIAGVAAYSTLGWFHDPVFSSMLRLGRDELIGTVFHELTHQKLYLRGDSAFSESLAMFVQRQGVREWREATGLPPPDEEKDRLGREFVASVLALRETLAAIYSQPLAPEAMRRARDAAIAGFRAGYWQRRADDWQGFDRFDDWVAGPIDNAKLVPFGLYDRWVSAFAALFREVGGDWTRFHERVAALAQRPRAERDEVLSTLTARAATP